MESASTQASTAALQSAGRWLWAGAGSYRLFLSTRGARQSSGGPSRPDPIVSPDEPPPAVLGPEPALRGYRRCGHEWAGDRDRGARGPGDGIRPAESSYTERLRAHGIEPALGHDAANLPPGAEVVVSTAIPEANPELAAARAAGASDPAPRRVARRGLAAQALDRGQRHPRQDDHLRDDRPGPGRVRARSGLPGGRRAAHHRRERRVGGGRVDRGGGRRVGSLLPAPRARRGGDHQRGARPPRHLPVALGPRGGVRRVRRPGATR